MFKTSKKPNRKRLVLTAFTATALLVSTTLLFNIYRNMKPVETVEVSTSSKPVLKNENVKDKDQAPVTDSSFNLDLPRDKYGMVEMPKTTSPYEAAAAVAAVLNTVQFDKLTREEFIHEALSRVTQPAPEYVGSAGQVDTGWHRAKYSNKIEVDTEPPYDFFVKQAAGLSKNVNIADYKLWYPVNGLFYSDMAGWKDHAWVAKPVMVLDNRQAAEINPNFDVKLVPEEVDITPDNGGSLNFMWVLFTVDDGNLGTAKLTNNFEMALKIWCDPPEAGGLCGLAGWFTKAAIKDWPNGMRTL